MSTLQNSGPRGPPLETLVDEGDPDILFDLIEEIAQGSYGHVFKAIYKKDGTICALKIIALEEDETFDDLKVEIALLKQCSHKNIVKYVGSWKKGEELFIAMELCDGGSLDRILELRKKGLNEAQLALIARESLSGLHYLHRNNILHRDIKAANVLMTSQGEVKLVDFGVSVITEEGQKRLTFIGSPYWMAPEVIDNRTLPSPYDFKADIWSLGVTMIELAENRVPLSELQPMAALRQIPRKDPPKLAEETKWSSEFKDFLNKCLQKEPDDRFSSEQLLSHPFVSNCKPIGVLVDLISEYQKYMEELELTSEESSEDNLNNSNSVISSESISETTPHKEGGDTLKFVPQHNSNGENNDNQSETLKKKKKNLDSEKDIENLHDLDEDEKQMLKSTLRDAQKKNRPVSLRKGNVVEELQKVKDAQILKQQLKAAKTQQANQLKERTNLEKNQKTEMKELERSFQSKLTKQDTKYKKDLENKTRNEKTDKENLLKKHDNTNKNLQRQHDTNTKNLQNSIREKQSEIKRTNQNNQKSSDRIFRQYQKNQKKDKKKDKKQVTFVQKRHEQVFMQKELLLNTELNQTMERDYTQLTNQQQLHQTTEKTIIKLPQLRHNTLFLIHSHQLQIHIDQQNLYSKHETLTEQNNAVRDLAYEHLSQLQQLEFEQQKQNHTFEREQQTKDQQKEQKAEFRKFKQNQKNDAKTFEREKKKELSRIKISRKESKNQMENEKKVYLQQQKADEMEFLEKLKWIHEEQDKQLNEYQKDQRERIEDLHDRAKKKKQSENEQQKLGDKQKFKSEKLETYQNQRIALFLEMFNAFKVEREYLIEAQKTEKSLQESHFKALEKLQRENLGHFQSSNAQQIERQVLLQRHEKQTLSLESEHKSIIDKTLGFKNDELVDKIFELQLNGNGDLRSSISVLPLTDEIPEVASDVLSQQKEPMIERQKKEVESLLSEAEKSLENMKEYQKNEVNELDSFIFELEEQLIEIHKETELALIEEFDLQFELVPKKEK